MNDEKIKQFIQKDKEIPDKVNATFDNFINNVKNDEIKTNNVVDFGEKKKFLGIYKFKKLITVAASLIIVIVASNVYARTQGYDNIFFMIKDLTTPKEEKRQEEIFEDRDIVISYKYLQITDDIQMQINELQIKDNKAKLYLLVKETKENTDAPLKYKVYNSKNELMYDNISSKKQNEKIYTEVLELSNYKNDVNELRIDIYNKNDVLVKTVTMNLDKKTIDAKTQNVEVQKISQIDLNKFLRKETEKLYSVNELKNKEIIILETYDIYYSNGKYIVKYLFMMPDEKDFEADKVEESDIYLNTVEFVYSNSQYKIQRIEKPEIFN